MQYTRRTIVILFQVLLFIVPLVFFTKNSEIFEFNKIIFTYIITILIISTWILDMIAHKKIIFRRTKLDIPILLFLLSQILSTFISIDPRTSLLGYYSRFHGGLLSYISYSLLYWAFVTYVNKESLVKIIKTILLSTALASIYAIFEHFGMSPSCLFVTGEFNVNCWVQDVQSRVFGTFGQPNWLAAWLAAILPLTWIYSSSVIEKLGPINKKIIYYSLSILLFTTLLFTKSRSGLLGFTAAYTIYWGLSFWRSNGDNRIPLIKRSAIITTSLLLITVLIGTQFTPSISQFLQKNSGPTEEQQTVGLPAQTGTVLERGGTESGQIRAIVWKGAIDLWKAYPILGPGTETFAHAYYQTRPLEHNLVSEWNFLYNKAHNEYLNFAATTGTFGIATYLFLIATTIFLFWSSWSKAIGSKPLITALSAGYVSILVTNFLGFSVVPIGILFFLFPAMATAASIKPSPSLTHKTLSNYQKAGITTIVLTSLYLILTTTNYWRADINYNKGKILNRSEMYTDALIPLKKAISLTPNEPLFHDELADSYTKLALAGNNTLALAIEEINKSSELSPRSVRLQKSKATTLSNLASINEEYALKTIEVLQNLKKLAPTDASIDYRIALNTAKTGDTIGAIEKLEYTIKIKPNYSRARLLLGVLYEDEGDTENAKAQYKYILEKINPENETVQEFLKDLENK